MKKYLLPKEGNFYKANLHCHTVISDGTLTPEQIKQVYLEKGYSIVAFTDHDIFIPHQDLKDDKFLPLNGFEIMIAEGQEKEVRVNGETSRDKGTCHICLIALDKDNVKQICHHRTAYYFENSKAYASQVKFDEDKPDYIRSYTIECVNDVIKQARENGFFVTYNHPVWSMEDYSRYINYNGMNAMEIYNHDCYVCGFEEYNPRIYDEMLLSGKRIYCVATDDNHNNKGSIEKDSFGGFTMIKAERLEYEDVAKSLVNGNFYSSQGPLIEELFYEDGVITVKCSNAKSICLNTGIRIKKIVYAEDGKALTQASFEVLDKYKYVRITVTDKDGKHAETNAYFIDQLK